MNGGGEAAGGVTLMDLGALAFVLVSGVGCWLARRVCFVLSEIERAVWEDVHACRDSSQKESGATQFRQRWM